MHITNVLLLKHQQQLQQQQKSLWGRAKAVITPQPVSNKLHLMDLRNWGRDTEEPVSASVFISRQIIYI